MLKCVAFDCFGTVFDLRNVPKEEVRAYANHVKQANFSPFAFPASWYAIPAWSDSARGIRDIQALGLKCIAMSNGDVKLIRHISERNGILWDGIVDLVAHGTYKPNDGAYDAVELQFGYRAAECLLVTANPTFGDVEGAAKIGMRSQVIRQPNGVWDGRQVPDDIPGLCEFVRHLISGGDGI